ncbi:MAG: hypothetical protein ACUVV6_03890 [Thermoplasmatota archaeon]
MDVYLNELRLEGFTVEMRKDYRIGRRIEQGADGDDIILEGRKSTEFALSGRMSLAQLKQLERELARGEPTFRSDLGEYKVAVKSLHYRTDTSEVAMELIEDVDH